MPKASSTSSSDDVKEYTGSRPRASPKSKPNTANRLTKEQRRMLVEMAMDVFLKHPNYKEMAEKTGLEVSTIRSQFGKVNWKNLRKSAIENA